MKYILFLVCFWLLACTPQSAISSFDTGEWQWSIEVSGFVSNETNAHPQAYLWIPPHCKQVRAIVIGQHNMSEEGIFEHPDFRKNLSELGFAEIWITPGIDQSWGLSEDTPAIFDQMLKDLAAASGYTELQYAPVVPIGHSAMATYPWNFGAWNPERTLAMLSIHGDAPRTHLTGYGRANPDWGDRTIEGIPGLMVMGEYEWWEDRLITAFEYRRQYPDAPLSMLADAGRGHFDHSDGLINYLSLFLKKAAQYRLPSTMPLDRPAQLIPVRAQHGWLADRWHKDEPPRAEAAPYAQYKGSHDSAFWYFDKEMAGATETYYAKVRGKKEQYIGFVQNGELLTFNPQSHVRISGSFQPEADGVTFHLSAAFTDTLRTVVSDEHAQGKIRISRICGPVKQMNDTTFQIQFYRMGLNNPRRTGEIVLLAENDGDEQYKSTVQQLSLRIPYRITDGAEQHIVFPTLADVTRKTRQVALNATASSGLPVYYYIKEGPAIIEDNRVVFTPVPPRAKYPVKVTVVAWQYGIAGQWQTAEAVERSFYILDNQDASSIQTYDFAPLDSLITGWIERGYYPGAAVKVVKADRVLFEKYYGTYTPETEVYIASAGKWLAAAAIATVVDQTELSWDDPIEKWLPGFAGDPKGKIRLRQLLSHTSGIPDYHPLPKRDTHNVLKDAVADIMPMDTVFSPGSRFQYGGLAMQIAGRMAEVASGMDFETLFQEKIAQPLEMKKTFFTPVSFADGHSPMLGGAARTIMDDYMAFLNMIFNHGVYNGKQVLLAKTIKEMQADQVGDAQVLPGEYIERAFGAYHTGIYGLGEWREKIDEHGNAYQISSPGWAGTYPWINTKDGVYGLFLTHVEGTSARDDGFSPFYDAPVISELISKTLE
nr:serine hydrolase domain-containing protein [Bacteroides sp. 51]